MELKEILAISKLPGLYQMITSRDNGIIVTPLGEQKSKFVSSRQHMFTPLENITVYTNTGSMELAEIFKAMKANDKCPEVKAADKDIRAYFVAIAPEHDQQRVYTSDIRKMIKWFKSLDEVGMFKEEKKEESVKKDKPKKEKVAKPKKAKATKKESKPKKK
ncbi:MAG: DUF5606 domain-containing protein [Chitinophagales bacterium]|nr:DUF5606 domain-containing protein [Chitinophagales bacterium]